MFGRIAAIAVASLALAAPAQADEPRLESVTLSAERASLPLDGTTDVRVHGRMSDGRRADLDDADVAVTSDDGDVAVTMEGDRGTARAGTKAPGPSTLTATVTLDGATATDTLELRLRPEPARPFRHDYHQTLTMKMFMADNQGRVSLTFEQALDVIRRVDNLTRGIPKIFYLVGWQYDGHDTGYPAWDVVNPKLKRAQDETALQSLRWLIRAAREHGTTVSFHINMLDASASSPLWQQYLDADVIARNADGSLRTYVWGYPISYTREWEAGLTQRRIDTLFEMVDMPEIGTVHVDAFHQYIPGYGTDMISPYHGVTTDAEVETQKRIMRYWRSRGVDVTSEFAYSYRKDPLLGLQPMSWHFRDVDPMEIPPTLHIGGAGGDARFGTSMQGESIIRRDPRNLPGFLDEFARTTLLWHYLNRLERLSDEDGVVTFEDGVTSRRVDGRLLVEQGDVTLRDGDDLFVPAEWRRDREIVAYSGDGYASREWRLPDDWRRVEAVDVYRIGQEGPTRIERRQRVREGAVELSLPAGTAVSVVPAGADVDDAVTTAPHRFAARAPRPGATGVDPERTVFEWDRSPYADEYRLLVTRDGEPVVDVTTRGTSHAAALAPGTDHEWTVEARNDRGSITADGAPLSFRTAYTAPPSRPARAAAYRTSETSVLVTWEAAENAATYTVERRAGDGAFTTVAAGVEGTSHTDAAAGGGPFEYRVTAADDLGASEPSAAAAERPVDLSGGRHLSDLPWESATSGWRSVARDRAVGGGELRLGGTPFAKGLGTHANSEIVYPLGPGDDLFRAVVGIDDAKAGSPGSVVFRVLADGEVLYDSGVMRAQPYSPPREVLVDVSGCDRLLLQVLDAGDGNNSDHADWADAQLLEVGP